MATAIQLPALSPTMEEGRITKWLKNEGDSVKSGDAIAECETDKSNLEIEATDAGVLLKIVVPAGSSAPIGATIAWIGKAGEAVPDAPAAAAAPKKEEKKDEEQKPEEKKAEAPAEKKEEKKPEEKKPEEKKAEAAPAPAKPTLPPKPKPFAAPTSASNGDRLKASPVAKKIAADQGVDLASVSGTGPQGRIVKSDVEQAIKSPPAAAAGEKQSKGPAAPIIRITPGERRPNEQIPLTSMRKVIAQRLGEVKPGVPHFYLSIEVEMDAALQIKDEAKTQELKISVNDIIIKAVAVAVRRFPRINQFFAGDHLEQMNTVDVGVAVAIPDGLITPIVKDADQKGLAEIAEEVRELAGRAKKKALKPEEYTGGSITVSNLGMFGIDSFIAVINPPQAAIIAVGKVEPKVVVRDGAMVIRNMMTATLSGDHRVIDGAVGAQYLQELKALLEHPLRLIF